MRRKSMKLNSNFVTQDIDDTQFLLDIGGSQFSGLVRSNRTAAFIVNLLKTETTKEQIINAMCAKYDAPKSTIEADVEEVLSTLRRIHALDE